MIGESKAGFQLRHANRSGETGVRVNEWPDPGCISISTEDVVGVLDTTDDNLTGQISR